MKPEFREAIELLNQGYDTEEIADELGVSRATAYRWIKQHETRIALAEVDKESTMSGLGAIEESNRLKRRELDLIERKEAIKREKKGRELLKKFKSLVSGIQEHAVGSKWTHEEVSDTHLKIEELKEEVAELLDYDKEAQGENSAFQILSILEEEFEKLVESGSGYTFNFDWSEPKLNLLELAISLEELSDDSFDMEDFHRATAACLVEETMNGIQTFQGESVDAKEVQKLEAQVAIAKEGLESLDPELQEDFEEDKARLGKIDDYLKELRIRVDESFWGSKRFQLPETDELIENGS